MGTRSSRSSRRSTRRRGRKSASAARGRARGLGRGLSERRAAVARRPGTRLKVAAFRGAQIGPRRPCRGRWRVRLPGRQLPPPPIPAGAPAACVSTLHETVLLSALPSCRAPCWRLKTAVPGQPSPLVRFLREGAGGTSRACFPRMGLAGNACLAGTFATAPGMLPYRAESGGAPRSSAAIAVFVRLTPCAFACTSQASVCTRR
jgi:hypothetical protein